MVDPLLAKISVIMVKYLRTTWNDDTGERRTIDRRISIHAEVTRATMSFYGYLGFLLDDFERLTK